MDKETFGSMTSDEYIEERVKQYQNWYDKKSVIVKSLYLKMRATSVVGGAIVPVLVNLKPTWINIDLITTIISLIVVIFIALETVYHYRGQWKNYRSTEQFLGREKLYFLTKEGPYKELASKEAFVLFVERIEGAIESENVSTLNVMTLISQPKSES